MNKLLFLLILLPVSLLFCQSEDPPYINNVDSTFYFLSTDFPRQTVRIELQEPITLNSIKINLEGKGKGNFDIDIFGHEGGANRPIFENKLIPTRSHIMDSHGREIFLLHLEEPLQLENDYFFVMLSNFQNEMGLVCDSTFIDQCNPTTWESRASPLILEDRRGNFSYHKVHPQIEINYTSNPIQETFYREHLILHDSPKLSANQSISWEDVNNDNWIDLLIGNYLWLNDSGALTNALRLDASAKHSAFIDFDNDNDFDILLFSGQGVSLFTNQNAGFTFSKHFKNLPALHPNSIAIADFNNDTFLDIFIAQLWNKYPKPKPNFLFTNQGGNQFIDTSSLLYPEHDGKNNFPHKQEMSTNPELYESSHNISLNKRSRAAQFIDFDLDGDQDLYVVNYFLEEDEFYKNNGHGKFQKLIVPIDSLISASPKFHENYYSNGSGISWSDFDNDGDFDFILGQLTHPGFILEYGHLGTTIFENVGNQWREIENNAGIKYEESHAGVAFGDINNDGLEDLFITSFYDCRYLDVYVQNTDHTYEMKTYESGLNKISGVHDICIIDYNNDGMQDACFIDNGTIRLFENKIRNNNNWLKIRLKGETVNSFGIGAVVRLFCGHEIFTKQLSFGRGQNMQSPCILHFGISNYKIVDKIEIIWSKEKRQILNNVEVNQLIEIIES